MRRWVGNALVFTVLWIFVRGVELTPVRLAEEAVIGLLVSLPLAYAVRGFYAGPPTERDLRVLPYAVLYLLVFLKELIVANFTVARVVISPSMPIDPAVVEVPLRVESDAAITTIANSITLTPGTLTMDYDADTNSLYVHSLNGADILDTIRTWEDYALVIFREELKPGDPVPEHGTGAGPRTDGGRDAPASDPPAGSAGVRDDGGERHG